MDVVPCMGLITWNIVFTTFCNAQVQDAIGRKWQCSTVQLDFNLPDRFDMTYIDADNEKKRPIMIHRYVNSYFFYIFLFLITLDTWN